MHSRLGYHYIESSSWNSTLDITFAYRCCANASLDHAPDFLPDLMLSAFRVIEHWRRASHPGNAMWCFQPAVRVISEPNPEPGMPDQCTILLVCTPVALEWSPLWPGLGEGPRGHLGDPLMTRRILYIPFERTEPSYHRHLAQVTFGIQSTGLPELECLFSLSHITTRLPDPVSESFESTGYPRCLAVQFPHIRWNPADSI